MYLYIHYLIFSFRFHLYSVFFKPVSLDYPINIMVNCCRDYKPY